MKRKSIISFIMAICVFVPAIIFLIACNDKKTVPAPEIINVYQDYDGVVYVEHSGMHDIYAPEFSLDGQSWFQTKNEDDKVYTVSIIRYDFESNKFVYMARNGLYVEIEDTTIQIGLREPETKTTKATGPSNLFTYTLKKPQTTPYIETQETLTTNSIHSPESVDYSGKNYIVGKIDSGFKYAFVKLVRDNNSRDDQGANGVWYTNNFVEDSTFASKLEYCLLDNSYRDINTRDRKVYNDSMSETLSFSDCSTNFTIAYGHFGDSTYLTGRKTALMAIRYKALNSSMLPSKCCIVEVLKNEKNYNISSSYNANLDFYINTRQTLTKLEMDIVLKTNLSVAQLSDIKSLLNVQSSYTYNPSSLNSETTFDVKWYKDGVLFTDNITASNVGNVFIVQIKIDGNVVSTIDVSVALQQE